MKYQIQNLYSHVKWHRTLNGTAGREPPQPLSDAARSVESNRPRHFRSERVVLFSAAPNPFDFDVVHVAFNVHVVAHVRVRCCVRCWRARGRVPFDTARSTQRVATGRVRFRDTHRGLFVHLRLRLLIQGRGDNGGWGGSVLLGDPRDTPCS